MTDLSHMNNSLESMYYTEVYVKTYNYKSLMRWINKIFIFLWQRNKEQTSYLTINIYCL